MRSEFLTFAPPEIGEEEIAEVVATLRSGWLTTGPRTQRFEREFAAFVGSSAALALNSGTSAMHVALKVLGVGTGDAVITTPMTFCSSVNVIEQVGARPVLVDVEPDTLNLDPARLEAAFQQLERERPGSAKAVLPVHLYGHPCDMDAIADFAAQQKLAVVEDAAHALPARYRGRLIGGADAANPQVPRLTAFSFYATKNLTTGEGGMLTGPASLLEEARIWSLHGMSRDAHRRYSAEGSWRYDVLFPGFKYNMPDVLAAIGLRQLEKLPALQRRRRQIVQAYNDAFSALDEISLSLERPDCESSCHLYVIRLRLEALRIDRSRFVEELRALNIGTSVHFIPIHLMTYYRDRYRFKPEDFPIANAAFQRIISLPLSPHLADRDVEDVIEAVTQTVDRNRR